MVWYLDIGYNLNLTFSSFHQYFFLVLCRKFSDGTFDPDAGDSATKTHQSITVEIKLSAVKFLCFGAVGRHIYDLCNVFLFQVSLIANKKTAKKLLLDENAGDSNNNGAM